MGEIINLRQRRKAAARDVKEAEASANRVKFGRTGAEKKAAKAELALAERRLDGHRLEPGDRDDGGAT